MPVEPTSHQGPRRSRGLEDIAPQYVAKSGLCASSEMESPRGSLRIRHLIGSPSSNQDEDQARFPRLDQCAHFHYDQVDLPALQVSLYNEELKSLSCDATTKCYAVQVRSHAVSWLLRRSYDNFKLLDQQLHRCVYDRRFSVLPCLPDDEGEDQAGVLELLERYLSRFSQIAGNLINCGPVLNWLELDNRGRRLLVPDNDNCPINTPAVAAAYSVRRYSAQAGDEISFEVGDMISVIDMPPPEESVWWRGKRGFQVGFFPGSCVAVIGDKLPRSLLLPASVATLTQGCEPSKPVLRKHGKLIAFFRSFILARPSRRRLKQSGILKERVFGCDLGEHLLNSGHQVPMVLKCCAEFIESHGIVDGIYRLSGVTSNIQKLRNAFDEDRVPALYEDEAILQDIHSVASLLKMYFRELPNPLCTYQLYHAFVGAVGAAPELRLIRMREAVAKLPPPHYRTLEYLMRHLARVAERGHMTGMTPRNVAIVWAPNLLRCKELEVGGVAALQGVGIQAVVTEFLVCYADLIFCDNLPVVTTLPPIQASPKRCRPKSLAISTPTKLLSLEEARTRALNSNTKADTDYIEVGGGPSKLPAKYHTVIELPRKRSSSKRSPLGWKSLFGKSGRKNSMRKSSTPTELGLHQDTAVTETDLAAGRRRLRPVKSAESLDSGSRNSAAGPEPADRSDGENSPPSAHQSQASLTRAGHNRSASHDSYFDGLDGTPAHARLATRPSRLQEMDNEDVSSSLDLSEIQLNFDLEDSEMRIFSEDETLVSTSVGSGSLVSHSSPRVRGRTTLPLVSSAAKRLPPRDGPPPRARAEESACPSLDPSPKKQKTCATPPAVSPTDSTRSKRSRLEERLASSTGELRFIDSQSPENNNTVTIRAEVHPTSSYSLSDTESYDPVLLYTTLVDRDSNCSTSSPSPLTTPSNPLYQAMTPSSPSSMTLPCPATMSQSSSLDIPYNRMSAPNLTPNSSLSGGNVTPTAAHNNYNNESGPTPEENVFRYENIPFECSRRPDYENVPMTPTVRAYQNLPADKVVVRTNLLPGDSPVGDVSPLPSPSDDQNLPADVIVIRTLSSPVKDVSPLVVTSPAYQNLLADDFFIGTDVSPSPVEERSPVTSPVDAYQNLRLTNKIFVGTNVSPLSSPVGDASPLASPTSPAYQNLPADKIVIRTSASPLSSPVKESLITIKYENVKSPRSAPCDEAFTYETVTPGGGERRGHDVYQNLPAEDEHVYEDVEVLGEGRETLAEEGGKPSPPEVVYQQVKYLRRSVHEVNTLVADEDSSVSVGEGEVSSLVAIPSLDPDHEVRAEAGETIESSDEATQSSEDSTSSGDRSDDTSARLDQSDDVSTRLERSDDVSTRLNQSDDESMRLDQSDDASTRLDRSDDVSTRLERLDDASTRLNQSDDASTRLDRSDDVSTRLERLDDASTRLNQSDDASTRLDRSGDVSTRLERLDDVSTSLNRLDDTSGPYSVLEVAPCTSDRRMATKDSNDRSSDRSNDRSSDRSNDRSSDSSPAHSAADDPEQSKRRIESEIGRDILRERRMRQELEEVRHCSLGAARRPGSIKDLLSRFEGADSAPPAPRLHRENGSLPPCVRARAAKTARRLANSTALSVSLDGGQFAAANNNGNNDVGAEPTGVLRPLNAIDDDPQRRERIERYKEERRMFLREKYRSESFRDETAQRPRQRQAKTEEPIERVRSDSLKGPRPKQGKTEEPIERVRSDSVKGPRPKQGKTDEPIERVRSDSLKGPRPKQGKTDEPIESEKRVRGDGLKGPGRETDGDNRLNPDSTSESTKRATEKQTTAPGRGKKADDDRSSNQRRDRNPAGSPEKRSDGPITCVLVKERSGSDRMTVTMGLKGAATTRGRLGSNPEPSQSARQVRATPATRPTSIDAAPADRSWRVRPETRSPDKCSQPWTKTRPAAWRTESKRPSSVETASPPPPSTPDPPPSPRRRSSGSASPSYCIRDMAAIFENRGAENARGAANRPPPPPNKQYLSSM